MKTYLIVEPIINGAEIPIPKAIPKPKCKRKWEPGNRVKKIDATIESANNRFGIYVGDVTANGKFCVGRYSIEGINTTDIDILEVFDVMSELQHTWELD